MKPFLKWVGGKQKLIAKLEPHLPKGWERKRFVEPFLGGGSMFFHLKPERAMVSDVNKDLVLTYQQVRDNVDSVIREVRYLFLNDSEERFKEVRQKFNDGRYPYREQRAAAFIYLNRACFNGLWRRNSKGLFNGSYGRYPKLELDEENLRECSAFLKPHIVLPRCFDKMLARQWFGSDTFVYLDPPYHSESDGFIQYHEDIFDAQTHRALKSHVDRLTSSGARVMLSYGESDFIRHLYRDYLIEEVDIHRTISAQPHGRVRTTELVITNYKEKQ